MVAVAVVVVVGVGVAVAVAVGVVVGVAVWRKLRMIIHRDPEREAKFASWKVQCEEFPQDYKIEYVNERGEYVDALLMRRADDQWYPIEALPRWYFKHGEPI